MRAALSAAFVAMFLAACGGGSDDGTMHLCGGANTTPASTNPDYASNFVGTWSGGLQLTLGGQSDTGTVSTTITRTSANKLAFRDSFVGSVGLVTSATTASLACMTGSEGADCGSIAMTFDPGTITLNAGGGLDLTWDVVASGCGQTVTGTATMTDAMKVSALTAEGSAATVPTFEDVLKNAIRARFGR